MDLVHGSTVTVTGSRRIRTGFPFQLLRLDIHELLLCGEDQFDQVGDRDLRRIGNTKRAQLANGRQRDDGLFHQVQLFERPKNPIERVKAELALGVFRTIGEHAQRRPLRF